MRSSLVRTGRTGNRSYCCAGLSAAIAPKLDNSGAAPLPNRLMRVGTFAFKDLGTSDSERNELHERDELSESEERDSDLKVAPCFHLSAARREVVLDMFSSRRCPQQLPSCPQ
jgi:hypothetical protein